MNGLEATIILILSFAGFGYLDEIIKKIKNENNNRLISYVYVAIIASASLYGLYWSLRFFKDI